MQPGDLGENITTRGIDLISLPLGTRLHLGREAVVELTGLRTPCTKIEKFQAGLLQQLVTRNAVTGSRGARAGVMAVVTGAGAVLPRDSISVHLPALPHQSLKQI